MVATYAIDIKKQKAQSRYPHDAVDRISADEALKRLSRYAITLKPGPGAEEAAAFVQALVSDPALSAITPSEDQQHALFALFSRLSDLSALFSLFLGWRGPRGLFELAIEGGSYAIEPKPAPHWVLVRGATPLRGWPLKHLVLFLLRVDPALGPSMLEQLKRSSRPLAEQSGLAVMFDDRAWANALIDEWLEQPPIGTIAAIDWDVMGLLGTTDDEARFRRFFEHASAKLAFAGRNALLARSLDRIGAEALVDVLLPFVEGGLAKKWKSSQVEPYAKALAHVRGEEVARVLALWVGEKSIAKVATDYFRAHPDLAAAALEPVAKGRGKAATVARAMLESLRRDAGPAGAAPKKKTKGASKASAAAASLPAVLTAPPWLAKKRSARPRLALAMMVEGERYALPARGYRREPAADRSPEQDARFIADRPLESLYEGALMNLTDEMALRALAARKDLRGWGLVDSLFAWLGEPALPDLARLLAVEVTRGAHTMLSRAESPRLALPCAALATARAGGAPRSAALAWLRAHPFTAALGLIPAALGDDDADADVAERALRIVIRNGHEAEVRAAAARYGDAAVEALDRLLARSPYDRFPAKMPPKTKWAAPERLGALELVEGGTLGPEHVTALIQMLQISPIGEPYAGATDVLAMLTTESKAGFAGALLDEYLVAGSPPSHEWVIGALGLVAPEVAIARLGAHMRTWAADGKVPLLHRSLEALSAIGTDEALIVVYDAGQRSRYDDTREKVRELLEDVARARSISYEVLEDVLVPELGLEHGPVELDLGGRVLSVRLGEHLEAQLVEGGKRLASFPRRGKGDDPDRYANAKARYAALMESADAVGRAQVLRYERALRVARRWRVRELRERVLPQPLVQHLARRLVWQVLESGQLFRVDEDLTLADPNDEPLAFPGDDAEIVLAHPLAAPGLAAFATWLDDYEVLQPFPQVHRETFALEPSEASQASLSRVDGRKASYLSVLALTLGMGWKPIPPGDRGIDAITRELSDGRVARLGIRPGLLFGGAKGRPEQTLGALTITRDSEPATFDGLDPIELSELLRDVMLLS